MSRDIAPPAKVSDLAGWLLRESEDEETAFLLVSGGRAWSPVGVCEASPEEPEDPVNAGVPDTGWLIEWEPYPDTEPPRAREFARFLLGTAPAWHPVVLEFGENDCHTISWPRRPGRARRDDLPGMVLDLDKMPRETDGDR